jgi:hypothetical protein
LHQDAGKGVTPSKISALGSMKKSIHPDDTRDTRPAATPDIPGASDFPDVTLPDINTLSLLATQPRFHPHNETDALRAALALWREAKRLLDRERMLAEAISRRDALLQQIKLPENWTSAKFYEFLQKVVGGKDEGEQLNRFRRFWLSLNRKNKAMREGQIPNEGPASEEELGEIEDVIANLKSAEFIPRFVWEDYGFRFNNWWAEEKVQAKRRGGQARVAKARDKKKSAKAA